MRRRSLCLCALAAVLGGSGATVGEAPAAHWTVQPEALVISNQINHYRNVTWHWQRVMGLRPTRTSRSARRMQSLEYRRWVRSLWKHRALKAKRRASRPPHRTAWLCIHRYEASWRDPNPPYYGGLQMDWTFMSTYGRYLLRRKGTADRWTPLEQMWVAEKALRAGRGFYPWPTTARYCGLL